MRKKKSVLFALVVVAGTIGLEWVWLNVVPRFALLRYELLLMTVLAVYFAVRRMRSKRTDTERTEEVDYDKAFDSDGESADEEAFESEPATVEEVVHKQGKRLIEMLYALWTMVLIDLLRSGNYYSFTSDHYLTFLWIALAIGLPLGVGFFVKTWHRLPERKGRRILTLLSSCFIAVFIGCLVLPHANYALDVTPPQSCTAVIKGKDYTSRTKAADSYEFELLVDGERLDLEVGSRVYKTYEIGDSYTFKKYNGAFGVPFYLSGDEVE